MNHSITRQSASMGCTRAACSCGITSSPTNAPQHLARWERAHLKAAKAAEVKKAKTR